MSTEAGHAAGPEAPPERPGWSRWVIIGAAMLAVLLIGATIGMFLTRLSDGSDDTATPKAGSVEVGFAQDMSVHHLQAVTMANWARDHSTDPEIRQIAFDIQSTQLEQIGRMKGWLMLWGQPEQAIGAYMKWMTEPMGHGHGGSAPMSMQPANGAPMPGMASEAELSKMQTLTGKALDVDFLQLMLRHHQGGTDMAQYGYDHSQLPAVKALAQSMLTSQGAEMNQMTLMLKARGADPLPAP
ncbi:DUF305 domain-containing protein [Amycolatopsis sp. NPDC059021]|uniref:DUF305 domain-containing protein n=1 Tax=Amycolatopsis sp. NPDC059021 TaxID=3346704 RepID=UPI0036708B34